MNSPSLSVYSTAFFLVSLLPPMAAAQSADEQARRAQIARENAQKVAAVREARAAQTRPTVPLSAQGPNVELLRAAHAGGARIMMGTQGGAPDPERLKKRLQAIKAAGLDWKDFYVPGKEITKP